MHAANMHYTNVLADFKQEWEAYKDLRGLDKPKVPKISDRDGDRKIIRWAPIFKDVWIKRSIKVRPQGCFRSAY